MELPTHILLTYGYLLLFAWVLVEQLGLPLPATPVLLAAGALSAEHQISFPASVAVGLAACLLSDTTWFFVGKRYGHHRPADSLQAFARAHHLCAPDSDAIRAFEGGSR